MKPGDYVFAVPGRGSIIDMAREDNTHTMILNETLESFLFEPMHCALGLWLHFEDDIVFAVHFGPFVVELVLIHEPPSEQE